jgi:hypothetical protein
MGGPGNAGLFNGGYTWKAGRLLAHVRFPLTPFI